MKYNTFIDIINSLDPSDYYDPEIKAIVFENEVFEFNKISKQYPGLYTKIIFKNCSFEKSELTLEKSSFSLLEISNVELKKLTFKLMCSIHELILQKCVINSFVVQELIGKNFKIIDGTISQFEYKDSIFGSGLESFKIDHCSISKGIRIIGLESSNEPTFEIKTIAINDSNIKKYLQVENISCDRIVYINNQSEEITFRKVRLGTRKGLIGPFFTYEIILNKITAKNISFNSCNLLKANFIHEDVEISQIKSDRTIWPTKIRNRKVESDHVFYLFLKKLHEGIGDQKRVRIYRARELQSFRKLKTSELKLLDRMVLWLNEKSNFYGESFLPAFTWISVGIPIWFIIYLLLNNSLALFSSDWGQMFSFFIPTHDIKFLFEKPCNLSLFLDFFVRLYNSYFIYQFIAAFRKYGNV